MHDLFGRPLVALDDWKTAAKFGKGATDVALIRSYTGVIERAAGDDQKSPIRIGISRRVSYPSPVPGSSSPVA